MNKTLQDCDSVQRTPLIAIEDAITEMVNSAIPPNRIEQRPLNDALAYVLAQDIQSCINVPPADNSAMDGYAVRYADLVKADNVCLKVDQRICAGQVGQVLRAGTAARIFTGATIPLGVDTVIMQELCQTKTDQTGDYVCIAADVCATIRKGSNIRRAGEDIAIEDIILKKGHTLRPQDLGLAASVGVAKIAVYRRLKVAIFSTGDELCEPGTALQSGQIYNSNRYTLTALLQNMGCEVIDLGIVKDNLAATQAAMLQATEYADVLMTSGGVSVGEEDHIRVALEALGQLNLWRINIKPGKPLAFGHIADTPFLGLPGNPVSVFVTFSILAQPYLRKLQGKTQIHPQYFNIAADFELKRQASREEYFRVRLVENSAGEKVLQAYPHQGSGVLSSTTWADGLARIPANTYINKGDKLRFYSFSS